MRNFLVDKDEDGRRDDIDGGEYQVESQEARHFLSFPKFKALFTLGLCGSEAKAAVWQGLTFALQ